jgi:HEAT repeat protein
MSITCRAMSAAKRSGSRSARRVAELLRDPAWIVRREAGLALRTLGNPGTVLLRRALRNPDRFAADMARQVMDIPG